jgi:hypothetical protein
MIYAVVDGHVHLDSADPDLLDNAARSLSRSAARTPDIGVLMLTEVAGVSRFDAFGPKEAESISFWHRKPGRLPLLVVAGRQIVTAEKLEVLALGTRDALPDGAPLPAVLGWCRQQEALAVLPWGVGKWLGRRGTLVTEALAGEDPRHFALGDNGGRPGFWRVAAFDAARRRGMKILPGSDPLPLAGQSARIGRFGFGLEIEMDDRAPARSLLAALGDPGTAIEPFGAPRPLHRFVAEQVALRLPHGAARA